MYGAIQLSSLIVGTMVTPISIYSCLGVVMVIRILPCEVIYDKVGKDDQLHDCPIHRGPLVDDGWTMLEVAA